MVTAMTPTTAGEGKTTTAIGLADALRRLGQEGRRRPEGAVAGARLRAQGRSHRGRPGPGRPRRRHQPPFHGRYPCHHLGPQPPGGHGRQPAPFRRALRPPRRPVRDLEAGHGHGRPGPPGHRRRPRRCPSRALPGKPGSTSPPPPRSWPSSAWPGTSMT